MAMSDDAGIGPGRAEKIMSLRLDEFEAGLRRIDPSVRPGRTVGHYEVCASGLDHSVDIAFAPLPEAVLGGLLKLPRARVMIDLHKLGADDRVAFLHLFDRTFQRGGG